ncbi:MAG TPA: tRNA (uridine(34)/cytosine(34)/5-carboxymethylaminomethyluridine(34)-2'-O)-methyltransferase TrmL, partial [Clostridiales bacterium]|nr:tRNA (uridine(34)/cytosine(34)/5-carboxymethylaminomethyluridine(34)-2'-O)-methyltransferase TrmL [Clostridiales bacterium]
QIFYYDCFEELKKAFPSARFWYFTTKGLNRHCDVNFKEGDFLVFGKETKGLPEELLLKNRESCLRIPMIGETRSLNLSNSVAIAVYEGLRQLDFCGFKTEGQLHNLKW